jgi:hypothetical protein
MAPAFASWVHGHAGRVERPETLVASTPFAFGWGLSLAGLPNTFNWLHFAIPTPVIVADKRYNITQIGIKATRQAPQARIAAVHAYDGHKRFYANESTVPDLPIVEQPPAAPYPDLGNFIGFPVGGLISPPGVLWGIGISLGLQFGGGDQSLQLDIASVGCDFIIQE